LAHKDVRYALCRSVFRFAVQPGDLVGTFTQHQNTEGITIERKESEARESATRRGHDLREPTNNIPRTIQLAAFFIF